MLHYLLVGGAGFLGFHVSRRLLSHGHRVSVLDDLSGYGAEGNLRDLVQCVGWTLMRHAREDARLPGTWSGPMVPRPHQVDRVVWLADAPSAGFERIDLQLRGVDCLVRWAQKAGAKAPRVLVVTGPAEYEASDAALARAPDLDVRRLRLRDIYGPRMSPRAFVQGMIDRLAKEPEVSVDAEEVRDLLHVEDAVTAVCRAVDRAEREPVVELRGPDVWRAEDLARALQRRTGARGTVRAAPPAPNGNHQDPVARARAVLGWDPSRMLMPSLEEVLTWHTDGRDLLAAEYDEDA